MSPSLKTIIPVALLASTASCFSFLYPVPGSTNLTVADGDTLIVSWDTSFSGSTSDMALNCAKTQDFTGKSIHTGIQTWTNVSTSLTYNVKSDSSYDDKQFCKVCAGSAGEACSGVFRVTPKAAGHSSTAWSISGNAQAASSSSAAPSSTVSSTPAPASNGTASAPGSSSNTTTLVPQASAPTTAPAASSPSSKSGAVQLQVSAFAMGALAFVAFVAL